MTYKSHLPLICALYALFLPMPALTAEKSTYVTVNHSHLQYELKGYSAEADGLLLGIGKRLTKRLNLEAAFGQYEFDTIQLGGIVVSNAEAKTLEVTTLVTWPLSKTYQPFLMVGLIHAEMEAPDLYQEDLQAPYLGLGIILAADDSWQTRAGYKFFPDQASAELLSIGLAYQF